MKKIITKLSPEKIIQYTKEFNSFSKQDLLYVHGTNDILITSVHGYDHIRKGNIKKKDSGSVLFAYLLARMTNSNFLAVLSDGIMDNNYHKNTDFKRELFKLKDSINLVLDIHGSHVYRVADIEIGTMYGKTLDNLKVKLFKEYFELYRYLVTENEIFAGVGEDEEAETIISYCHKELKLNAIQLEINSSLIFEENMSRIHMHNYAKLLNCMTQIITSFYE